MPRDLVQRFKELFIKCREGRYGPDDTINLIGDLSSLPEELIQELDKIDKLDCFTYKEGIDTDSLSYKFNNILQMFKVNYSTEIKVHSVIIKIESRAMDESQFIQMVQRDGGFADQQKYVNNNMLFDARFNFNSILGQANLM